MGSAKNVQGTELIKLKSCFQEPDYTTFILTVQQLQITSFILIVQHLQINQWLV